jgi:hypothetical protein
MFPVSYGLITSSIPLLLPSAIFLRLAKPLCPGRVSNECFRPLYTIQPTEDKIIKIATHGGGYTYTP